MTTEMMRLHEEAESKFLRIIVSENSKVIIPCSSGKPCIKYICLKHNPIEMM